VSKRELADRICDEIVEIRSRVDVGPAAREPASL
jgi:hypothetical protein